MLRVHDYVTKAIVIIVISVCLTPSSALANEFLPQIQRLITDKIEPWLADETVLSAVRAQNASHAGMDSERITALDTQWRDEAAAGSGPLIDTVLGNDLSAFLIEKKDALNGVVSEIFVMDNVGLNVGQSDITSDYWQGDEEKWQKTFAVGPGATFVDEVDFDDSAESFLSQASVTIVDPNTGEAIGAITVGINVEKLF